MSTVEAGVERWTAVCRSGDLLCDRGVSALVDGEPVAVFRLSGSGDLYAIGNVDPFSGASVLSRGLVGTAELDRGWEPYVASPLRRQRFSLRSGRCLDDDGVRVPTHPVRLDGDVVLVGPALR